MPETKNLCAQIPLELHTKVCEAKEQTGQTTNQYITDLLIEYFKMKENGGKQIMAANGNRTMAFQISEDLFQRIKAHLERETARTGKKLTQREFVLGLIMEALDEAEREAQESAESPEAEGTPDAEAPETEEAFHAESPEDEEAPYAEPSGIEETPSIETANRPRPPSQTRWPPGTFFVLSQPK